MISESGTFSGSTEFPTNIRLKCIIGYNFIENINSINASCTEAGTWKIQSSCQGSKISIFTWVAI